MQRYKIVLEEYIEAKDAEEARLIFNEQLREGLIEAIDCDVELYEEAEIEESII